MPICEACLEILLAEHDPGRRRALAGLSVSSAPVIERLSNDADDFVRCAVASRGDLDPAIARLFVNQSVETSPPVWCALAASQSGPTNADAIVATGDALSLVALAGNVATPRGVLGRLVEHPDPEVATAAIAMRAGLNVDPRLLEQIARSTNAPSRPITARPMGTVAATGAQRVRPARVVNTSHRRIPRKSLAAIGIGAGLIVLTVSFSQLHWTAVVADTPRTSLPMATDTTVTTEPGVPLTSSAAVGPTTTTTGPRTTSRPAPPTTQLSARPQPTAPATVEPPSQRSPAPASVAPPPIPTGPTTRTIAVRSAGGRFCGGVQVTVNFSPSPATVQVTDDQGRTLANWKGVSGRTESVQIATPTTSLSVMVTVSGSEPTISASASGSSC